MSTEPNARARTAHEIEDEKSVRSVPLDTEDGGTVVIEQQNMGGAQQVGGGEFKNEVGRTVDEAAAEQEALERDAPIEEQDSTSNDG